MPARKVEKVHLSEEEVSKLTKIERYSTIKEDYYFDELYCDPIKRVFYRRSYGDEFRVRNGNTWIQGINVSDMNGKLVYIYFRSLIRQYPELRPLYDPNWKPPVRVHIEDGKIDVSVDDSALDSSIVSSFLDSEELSSRETKGVPF